MIIKDLKCTWPEVREAKGGASLSGVIVGLAAPYLQLKSADKWQCVLSAVAPHALRWTPKHIAVSFLHSKYNVKYSFKWWTLAMPREKP